MHLDLIGEADMETCHHCHARLHRKRPWTYHMLGPLNRIGKYSKHFFSEYQTAQTVTVKSYCLGICFRVVQLGILAYLIGYVFILKKSYQEFDTVEGSVTVKVKGVLRDQRRFVWDAVDFVIPPQEKDAFFIATSILRTDNQTHGVCAEDPSIDGVICRQHRDCPKGEATAPMGNGFKTGRCVPFNSSMSTCQVSAWCPLEKDESPKHPQLTDFGTVTVLIKNHIAFPKFNIKRRNILDTWNDSYLGTCRFHPVDDPVCPIFGFRDMVKFANTSFQDAATKGAIISIRIQWDCNLDFDLTFCLPEYSFRRLDSKSDKLGKGWNFRHAVHHLDPGGNDRRDLIKVWGIRFVIHIDGSAGRFSPVNFALDAGSGLGLLEVASIVCGLLLLLSCIKTKATAEEDRDHSRSRANSL